MKKKILILFLLIMVLLVPIIFIYKGNSDTKVNQKETTRRIDTIKNSKKEVTSFKNEKISDKEEVKEEPEDNSNNIQNNNSQQENTKTNQETKSTQTITTPQPEQVVQPSQNVQFYQEESKPAVDLNAVDTSHPLYNVHRGVVEYQSVGSCLNGGYSVMDRYPDKNLAFSCVEVHTIGGSIKGYFLSITEEGVTNNSYK